MVSTTVRLIRCLGFDAPPGVFCAIAMGSHRFVRVDETERALFLPRARTTFEKMTGGELVDMSPPM